MKQLLAKKGNFVQTYGIE